MVIALTQRHWLSLIDVTNTSQAMDEIASATDQNPDQDGGRYAARVGILEVLQTWSATKTLDETGHLFDEARILWGPFQTFTQMVNDDPRASTLNPMFEEIDQPGVGRIRAAGSPLNFVGRTRKPIRPAAVIGADTDAVLREMSAEGKSL
jgi:2-methylfumaryl-CoA isomerase